MVATLALFIAIGGASAFAATQLAKNSVGTKQLKKNAVTTAKIKAGAVTGAKITLSSLGKVPSASQADNATTAKNSETLQGLSAAQITTASKLTCPSGTVEVVGLCFETSPRPEQAYFAAWATCARAGRILPSMSDMGAFSTFVENITVYEWAGQFFYEVGNLRAPAVTAVDFQFAFVVEDRPFRCAVPPSN